jgi:co-chaperonin GroES (HSP10)
MTPRKSHCLIVPDARPEKVGAIFLPSNRAHTGLPSTGVVKYMNPASEADFQVGDHVLFRQFESELLDVRGEKLSFVKIADVQAVLP